MQTKQRTSSSRRYHWRRLKGLIWTFVLVNGLLFAGASEEDYIAPSHELKAAFIYNFILFSQWPDDIDRLKLKIGIVDNKPLFEHLKLLESRSESSANYTFYHFPKVADYQPVDMLWVGTLQIQDIKAQLSGKPIIVVGEELNCWQQNLHICLIKQDNLFRFKIDLFSFQQSGLKISSKVIRLAKEVRK